MVKRFVTLNLAFFGWGDGEGSAAETDKERANRAMTG
jgi:hypothetical protein